MSATFDVGTTVPAPGGRPAMTRRTMTVGAATVLAVGAALAACTPGGRGSQAGPATAPTVPAAQPQPTAGLDRNQQDTLLWLVVSSNAGARGEAYDAMTRRFNERFPNVKVEQVSIGGSIEQTMQQLPVYLSGGQRVDIVGVTPEYVPVYAERLKALKDLRAFLRVDTDMKESDHADGVVDSHVWKGSLYALPVGIATNHACLNLDLLAQAGIAPPGPDWTIDQALDIARRTTVRRGSDEESTWGFYQWWQGVPRFTYSWIRGNGGEPLTPNENPTTSRWATDVETRDTVQWLVDLASKVGVMPVTPVGGSWGTFREGRGAISVMETNNLFRNPPSEGTANFNWDVQNLPAMKRGRYYPNWAFSYGISANTKNPDVVWEMLKQVVGPAGQTSWFQLAKFAPSVKSLLNGAYLQDKDPPANKKAIVDSILASRAMPKSLHWVEINNVVAEVLTSVRAGRVSVNEGLADIDRRTTVAMQQG